MIHPSTPSLAGHCQTETDNFIQQRHYDPQYCYELFVRAFRHGESAAFDHLLSIYNGLVIHWAKRHSLYGALQGERDKVAHYTFIKMWKSTCGERFTFDSLPAILGYLRDCIDASLCEMYRDFIATRPPQAAGMAPLSLTQAVERQVAPRAEAELDEPADFELLWQRICVVLPEPQLQKLVWYSFVNGYKPEALMADFPDEFPGREEVRVLKQKAVRRLRKDPALRRWFGMPEGEI